MSGLPAELFRPVGSFLGVPQRLDIGDARAAIVGLPFDCGQHPRRVGARLGPAAIRMMSTDMVRHYRPEGPATVDPVAALGLVDCGDVAVVHGDLEASLERMTDALAAVVATGAVPIGLGGDGMVSVPMMRALHERHPDLVVVHFDSHTDAYPDPQARNAVVLDPATTFAYAAQERLVDTRHSLHVGLRGLSYVPGVFDHAEGLGYRIVPMTVLERDGVEAAIAAIRETVGTRPVFVCFDMDVFDPATAPGVFTPAWGGLTAREGLALVRGLAGLSIVGFDINTVTPGFDVGGQTAWLAATVALEFCHLLASV
ncbi:arginase family protein [Acuticoccus sp.]|uniref:arginase family protein n=1 Tax=Acuticoccus sp. TaxID=1904378 RepID=UPI003B51FB64